MPSPSFATSSMIASSSKEVGIGDSGVSEVSVDVAGSSTWGVKSSSSTSSVHFSNR
jgi:hypothetical protein